MAGSPDATDVVPRRDRGRAAPAEGDDLRRALERYEALVAATASIVWTADGDGRMTEEGPSWEAFTGQTPSAYLGSGWLDAVHPEDREAAAADWAASVAAGGLHESECRLRRRDGVYRRMAIRGVPIPGAAGRIREWVGTCTDVTERAAAADAIREREARYRWLVENTSDAVWRFELDEPISVDLPDEEKVDRTFRFAYLAECNAAMAAMYGYASCEELVGARLTDLMPRDRPENVEYLRAFMRSGFRLTEAESSEVAADGSTRHVVNSLVAEVHDGKLVRAWGTSRDVTERKQTEAALRQSRAMLRTVLDNIPHGVFWKDRNSVYLGANAVAARGAGFTRPEEVIGKTDLDLAGVTPDVAEARRRKDREVLDSGRPITDLATPVVGPDGATVWYNVHKAPLVDADGRLIGVLATAEDVTDRRRSEQALRDSEERLRLASEATGLGVFDYDPLTNRHFWSERAKAIWGFPPGEPVASDRIWKAVPLEDRDRSKRAAEASLDPNGSGEFAVEHRVLHPDGSVRWVSLRGRTTFEGAGDARRAIRSLGTMLDVTEQRRATEALREAEARMRLAVEATGMGVWHVDYAAGRVTWSAQAKAIFGLPPDADVTHDLVLSLIHPDDRELVMRATEESWLPERSGVFSVEHRVVRSDGSMRWVAARGRTIGFGTSDSPRPERHAGIVLDITERKRAEEALRDSEAWLRTVTDNLPALVGYVDRDLRYRFANRAYLDWFGLAPDEVVGKTVAEVLGEMTFAHRRPQIEAVLRGEPARFEGPMRHRRLGWRDTEVVYTPDLAPSGEPRGFFTLVHDVTERKRAEIRHREAEEQFRTLADNMPQLAWMADPTGAVVWYNRRWYDYTGTTPERMQGWGWRSVIDPEMLPRVVDRWRESLATGVPFDMTFALRAADGTYRPFLTRVMPVRDGDGQVVRWFGTNTDVTEQRELEHALRESDRRKDEFLATLGHELRNPLASIVNAAEAAAGDRGRAAGGSEMIEIVERQARHMSRLIDDLLDVSRIARGKILLRSDRLDLAELVSQTAEDHRREVEEAGLSLAVEVFNRPLWVEGDRTRLAQVLGNLLHNAVKFTDFAGRIVVAAALEEGHAAVRVRDTGLGMTSEMLARVFVPFSQADASLARSRGGLGLGLALVKGLVDLHGGSVSAESTGLGRGAEFLIRLPLVDAPAKARTQGGATSPVAARLRVLAVDDRRDILRPLQVLLAREGHEVEVAMTGRAGVEAAKRVRPDAVICDIGLPGEWNGHDVARELRGDPTLAGVRLIALTGYGQESDRQAALAAGFDLHLTKPVDIRVLRSALAGVMPVPR